MSVNKSSHKRGIEYRKSWYGRFFVLIWVIGFIPFFLLPLISTIGYSFSEMTIQASSINMKFVGLENYIALFRTDATFMPELLSSFTTMLYEVPFIIAITTFFALLLNQKFRGRTLARAVMFLPVIVTSGVVIYILKSDVNATYAMNGVQGQSFIQLTSFVDLLSSLGASDKVVSAISSILSNVSELVWKCGVQVLLFLAGLQSVPSSFFEAASVEGANAWEKFWKITFPMLSPVMLTGIIYTIIDSFTYYSNNIMQNCINPAFNNMRYAYACSMSITYSLMVLMIVGAIFLLIGRRVVYTER